MIDKQSIYLFCGEDSYSAAKKCSYWRSEFEKKYGDLNVNLLEGEAMTFQEFVDAVDSAPLLSEKKLVIIRSFLSEGNEETQNKVSEKLGDIAEYTLLVFLEYDQPDARRSLYKKIKKVGHIEEFPLLAGNELTKWITEEFKKTATPIGPSEIELLAETVGPNLWQMKQEIEKLSLYCGSNHVTTKAISSLVSANITTSIFKLTDFLAKRQPKQTLQTFHTLMESGEDIIMVFFMIVRHFRILLQIRDCLDHNLGKNEILGKVKEHPYVVTIGINQSKNFTFQKLAKIYQQLLKIDTEIKTGKIKMSTTDQTEMQLSLEKFILELAR